MKKLIVTDKTACKACLQCEVACSTAFYKVYESGEILHPYRGKKRSSQNKRMYSVRQMCPRLVRKAPFLRMQKALT